MKTQTKFAALALGSFLVISGLMGLALPGCASKLDSSGVYAQTNGGGMFLFTVDKTLVDSKDTLTAFVTWEYQNRATISAVIPNVTKIADTIREQAPTYFTNAYQLRGAYLASFANNAASQTVASNNLAASVQTINALAMSAGQLTNSLSLK